MVELSNVTLGYGGPSVLRDVTLDFPAGAVTALIGPNGSGKSTLLKAIVGLTPRVEGEITVDGQDARPLSPAALAQHVAFLPQTRRVPEMTAGRLVLHGRFPWLRYPRRYRPQDFAAARSAMERIGVGDLWDAPMATLSGGTRQKVYLAMALAQDTETILLDEPTSFLDIGHQIKTLELCRDLAQSGKAVAVVLHDLPLAFQYADRIALISGGGLRALGTPTQLLEGSAIFGAFGVRMYQVQTPAGMQYVCGKE